MHYIKCVVRFTGEIILNRQNRANLAPFIKSFHPAAKGRDVLDLDVFPAVKDGGFHAASLKSSGTTLKSNSLTFGRSRVALFSWIQPIRRCFR